jgi:hypothetical protein
VLVAESKRKDSRLKDNFRSREGGVVPYIRIGLDDDNLWGWVRVVVGPCPHMDESMGAIRSLLACCHCDLADIIPDRIMPSSAPYRHW